MEEKSDHSVVTTDLIENGEHTVVTNENRDYFVALYTKHIMSTSIDQQFKAIADGFYHVCFASSMKFLQVEDFQLMLCGQQLNSLDFRALSSKATYEDGFSSSHPLIKGFWNSVLNEFSLEEKKQLLKFVTGNDRVPFGGLGNISFIIQRNGVDSESLPTAMTCFSRLLLPEYSSVEKLISKLKISLMNNEGFGLV